MGTIISNNTGSNNIAYPDYWAPGFSLQNCLYAGLYHLDDLTVDLSGNGRTVTIIGTEDREGIFPRFDSGLFKLNTDLFVPTGDISVVALWNKSTAIPGDASPGRGYLLSSYGGGSNGISLTMEGTNAAANPGEAAVYRAAADAPTNAIFAKGGMTASADGWALTAFDSYMDTDGTTARVVLRNLLTGGSVSGAGLNKPGWAAATAGVAIGGRPLSLAGTTKATIASVLIYGRKLTSEDYAKITQYYKSYMLAKGINL